MTLSKNKNTKIQEHLHLLQCGQLWVIGFNVPQISKITYIEVVYGIAKFPILFQIIYNIEINNL